MDRRLVLTVPAAAPAATGLVGVRAGSGLAAGSAHCVRAIGRGGGMMGQFTVA